MAPTRPLSLNKSNGLELPNEGILSLFKQTTCSASAFIHYNTLKVHKLYSYSDLVINPDYSFFFLSSSVQTAYHKTGVSNRSNSFTNIIYTGVYTILDAQNLHTFSQSCQTPGLQA